MISLESLVKVSPRYQRAINLNASSRSAGSLDGYIITPNIGHALQRIVRSIQDKTASRAFYLYGPYGSGKSSFAVFLSQLLSQEPELSEKAFCLLNGTLPTFSDESRLARGKGFLVVSITARKQAMGLVLCQGILDAVSALPISHEREAYINELVNTIKSSRWKDSSETLALLHKLSDLSSSFGFSGVLLIMDEAGKMLEYALQDKADGDIYLFQQVAEFANNIDYPFIFLISLHQLFDEYVELADKTLRAEWNKVQERFEPIQFNESAVATMRMIAAAIGHPQGLPEEVRCHIKIEHARLISAEVQLPVGLDADSFLDLAYSAWPIHPLTLLVMPWIFRNLGQNERSIFTWLSNDEPNSFQQHLRTTDANEDSGFIRLHHLHSFFMVNFASSLAHQPRGRALTAAEEAIQAHPRLEAGSVHLLASIGILSVPGILSALGKGEGLLLCAMPDPKKAMEQVSYLLQCSIITPRRLDNSYRIWEGSDVDLQGRLEEAHRHVKNDRTTLIGNLKKYLPPRRIVARRHAIKSGTYRFFDVIYCADLSDLPTSRESEGAGFIAVLLPIRSFDTLREEAVNTTTMRNDVIVAIPHQMDVMLNLVEEMSCLQWVTENTPELRDDRVARRELDLRRTECIKRLEQHIQLIMDPRQPPAGNTCCYFYGGAEESLADFSDLIRITSRVCDELYPYAPLVRNELIARRVLSSAAASARRIVMEGILEREDKEALGISGFPAEKSIYASVLQAGRLHVFDDSISSWKLRQPVLGADPLNFLPCFELMEREIFNEGASRVELVNLFRKMTDRPFGIPDGLHPLLFMVFWKINRSDLFLYRENSFLPETTMPHFELLQRRPDLFSVAGMRLSGMRRDIIGRFAVLLGVPSDTVEVTKKLFMTMLSLPHIAQRSNKIGDQLALAMRAEFMQAQAPEQLIFADLPKRLGFPSFAGCDIAPRFIMEYTARVVQCLEIFKGFAARQELLCRDILLKECNLEQSDAGWKELLDIAPRLAPRIKDPELSPFLTNLIRQDGEPSVQQVISFIGKKAFERWTDAELDRFPGLAKAIGERFTYFCRTSLGDILLTEADLVRKNEVALLLRKKICTLKNKRYPDKIIVAAVQQVMQELMQGRDN